MADIFDEKINIGNIKCSL